MDFGCMLKTLRLSAGVGLRELSRRIDVSPTYLSLIENGKQIPPNAVRIAQIEQALEVPVGCLSCHVGGMGAGMADFITDVPETADFLELAKRNGMASTDFMVLTRFLNVYGWNALRDSLESALLREGAVDAPSRDHAMAGLYLWPFLRKELIFDAVETTDKIDFLENLLCLVAERTEKFDIEPVLAELLEREAVTGSGIGEGVAVPHTYLADFKTMIIAFARIPGGLDFNALDAQPVKIAILLLGPRSAENLHLRLLARIAKLLSYRNFRNRLLEAQGPADIISIFREAEVGIP